MISLGFGSWGWGSRGSKIQNSALRGKNRSPMGMDSDWLPGNWGKVAAGGDMAT